MRLPADIFDNIVPFLAVDEVCRLVEAGGRHVTTFTYPHHVEISRDPWTDLISTGSPPLHFAPVHCSSARWNDIKVTLPFAGEGVAEKMLHSSTHHIRRLEIDCVFTGCERLPKKFPNVTDVTFGGNCQTDCSLWNIAFPSATHLTIKKCAASSGTVMFAIATNFPRLARLELDESCAAVVSHCILQSVAVMNLEFTARATATLVSKTINKWLTDPKGNASPTILRVRARTGRGWYSTTLSSRYSSRHAAYTSDGSSRSLRAFLYLGQPFLKRNHARRMFQHSSEAVLLPLQVPARSLACFDFVFFVKEDSVAESLPMLFGQWGMSATYLRVVQETNKEKDEEESSPDAYYESMLRVAADGRLSMDDGPYMKPADLLASMDLYKPLGILVELLQVVDALLPKVDDPITFIASFCPELPSSALSDSRDKILELGDIVDFDLLPEVRRWELPVPLVGFSRTPALAEPSIFRGHLAFFKKGLDEGVGAGLKQTNGEDDDEDEDEEDP